MASKGFIVVFAHSTPLPTHSLRYVLFVDINQKAAWNLFVSVFKECGHFWRNGSHFGPEGIKGNLFVLFLVFLDAMEDTADIELHAPDEGDLEHEGTHEVVEDLTTLLLQLHWLVLLQVSQ